MKVGESFLPEKFETPKKAKKKSNENHNFCHST